MFDVITIGTATRDIFLTSSLFKILRDPAHLEKIGFKTGEAECFALGSKIEIKPPIFTVGGGAANAAVTFARQGFRTAAVIKIGDDESGDAVIADLKKEKVVPLAARDKKEGTAYSTILLTPNGERTILVYRGASENWARREIPWSKLKARWAYIAPGKMPLVLMEEILKTLKKRGTKIAMNPESRFYLEIAAKHPQNLFKYLDLVSVNREEASYLTGVPYKNDRGIFKKFDGLIEGIAVMTDGPKGAKVSNGRYLYTAPAFKEKKLVDRTGAGDAFGSGFVAGLMIKHDINFALRLATANATSVVEAVGAQEGILTRKDLNQSRFKYLDLDVEPL